MERVRIEIENDNLLNFKIYRIDQDDSVMFKIKKTTC